MLLFLIVVQLCSAMNLLHMIVHSKKKIKKNKKFSPFI